MTRLTLRVRLFVSYALVVAVRAAVMAAVIEIVGRQLFDHHMSGLSFGRAGHAGASMAQVQTRIRGCRCSAPYRWRDHGCVP